MRNVFPNFNLVSLLDVVELHFTPTTNTAITRIINSNETGRSLRVRYENQYTGEDDALLFIRSFSNTNGQIVVNHEYCVLPKSSRGRALIKPVFQESLRQYINMNAEKILVHAGLSAGGYTWAKHGFAAVDKAEVQAILEKARQRLPDDDFAIVKTIYDVYYGRSQSGKLFPMQLWAALEFMKPILAGSNWHGELDLKNEEQFHNFMSYVFR